MLQRLLPVICLFLATTSVAMAQSKGPTAKDPTAIASQLLDDLDAGRYEAAANGFTEQMRTAVPAEKLKQVWESLPAQAGAAKGRGEAVAQPQGLMTLVVIPLHYANLELVAKVAIDTSGQIAGFLIQPAPPPPAAAAPADAPYIEREVAVGNDGHSLPGTLALPKGAGPFPAVVLVHGSGPQDRDETIGPNRPFLDLARGLAAEGIAVLRYEKRTKARPGDYVDNPLTVDTETTQDAVAAVALLRTLKEVDGKRIYILGHSQGGMMAPRIAQRANATGVILLAAPSRPLLDILIEQNRRLAAMSGDVSAEEAAMIDKLAQQVTRIRAGAEVPPQDTPMGLPAAYWRSIDTVNPVAEAKAIHQPLLLLQGARDIQVVDTDWQRWQAALGKESRATFKHYPALNHLAIAGEGPGTLAEYQTPGHVDARVIDDVAVWIRKH
ncbi:alpha/beta hydrolase [Lysobacter tyrosinilyticus]